MTHEESVRSIVEKEIGVEAAGKAMTEYYPITIERNRRCDAATIAEMIIESLEDSEVGQDAADWVECMRNGMLY